MVTVKNTPGTAGGPGDRDRTLAVKSRKKRSKIIFFSRSISYSYAKIMGETNFQPQEFPQSGSKGKDGEKIEKKKKKRRRRKKPNGGNNNGQLRIATPPAAWASVNQ